MISLIMIPGFGRTVTLKFTQIDMGVGQIYAPWNHIV